MKLYKEILQCSFELTKAEPNLSIYSNKIMEFVYGMHYKLEMKRKKYTIITVIE